MASRSDDYRFLQLVDALASINQKVNLMGVVVETSIPKQSKGTGNSLSFSPRIMNHGSKVVFDIEDSAGSSTLSSIYPFGFL